MSCTSLISHVLRGVESEACDMEFSQGDHIQLQVAGGQSPGPEFPSVWEVPIVWNASSSAMIVIIVVRLQVQITVVIYS
jgi:hypothetical protein